MLIAGRLLIAAMLVTALPTWQTDAVDDRWAEKVLAEPDYDQGWSQSCHDDWSDGRESYCEVRELPYRAEGRPIAIDGGQNGGMTVMGWERNEVRVIYRVKARGDHAADAKALAEKVRVTNVRGWLTPQGPPPTREEWWSVELKVWVPRASNLSLRTLNGPAAIRGVRGTMEVHAQNGPVSLVELGGAVYARVQNGPLHVALDGSRWSGAGLDAEAQNGPVNLVLPKDYSARLETGTVNGPAVISYPIGIEGRIRGQFTKTLGSGGPPVRVVTENGPFRFAQR
jgi:hypothetical protein